MYRIFAISSLLLLHLSLYAGNGDYAVSKIPLPLLKNAHAVKRMESLRFEVISIGCLGALLLQSRYKRLLQPLFGYAMQVLMFCILFSALFFNKELEHSSNSIVAALSFLLFSSIYHGVLMGIIFFQNNSDPQGVYTFQVVASLTNQCYFSSDFQNVKFNNCCFSNLTETMSVSGNRKREDWIVISGWSPSYTRTIRYAGNYIELNRYPGSRHLPFLHTCF